MTLQISRHFRQNSVRLLVLAALLPLTLGAAFLSQLYQRSEEHQIDEQLRRTAERAALSVTKALDTQVALLTILAESPRLDPPMEAAAFREIADRLRERLPEWSSIRVSDLQGNLLTTSPLLREGVAPKAVDLESLRQSVATATPVIGSLVVGPLGSAAFAVRVPVLRNGIVVSVLSAVLRPPTLIAAAEESAIPAGWQVKILDDQGRTIAEPSGAAAAEQPLADVVHLEATATDVENGLRAIASPVGSSGWRVFVGMPLEQYQAPGRAALWALLAAGLLSAAIVGSGVVLARRELKAAQERDVIVATWQRFDALSKMAGGLSHDFNNLLMGMLSGVEQLRKRRDDPARFDQTARLMLESVEKGRVTVQRLASFTKRSDAGARLVCLRERAKGLMDIIAQALPADIAVRADIAPDLWAVRLDLQDLEVALVNLAANSRDAMPDGGEIVLEIRNVLAAEQLTPQMRGPAVAISLRDNGRGIAPEHIHRVFDPFFTTRGPDAKGLGLSQVYGFARRSGGAAVASSVPNAGTIVHILLPRTEVASHETVEAEAADLSPLSGMRVLVVDDDATVAQGVAGIVESAGMLVDIAASGAEGLFKLNSARFDLLISDITMPAMSGIELAEQAVAADQNLAVVLMTGYSDQLENGSRVAFPILPKPFGEELLLRTAAEAVSARRASGNVVQLATKR